MLRGKQLAEFNAKDVDLSESISALKAAMTVLSKHDGFGKVTKLVDAMIETLKEEQGDDDDHKKEHDELQFDTADDTKQG